MNKKLLVAVIILALATAGLASYHISQNDSVDHTHTNSGPTKSTTLSGFNKKQYSVTDPASIWVVVNKQHPLRPITYAPTDLITIGNGQQMRANAADELQKLFTDAKTAGYSLSADSGYRSYATQILTYNSEVKAYGQSAADSESARAGYSEHQTGWAVDIGSGNCHVADCFADTPAGKWTYANAYKYGFILRYTSADTSITGYRPEAWHFRYVGAALATEMRNQNIPTLEQFFGVSGGTEYKN